MVVNPVTLTPKVPEVNGVKPQEIDNEAVVADKVSISSKAREIQQERIQTKELTKKVIAAAPDIREDRVSEVIERLNNHSVKDDEVVNTVAERMAKMMGIG
jgi:hypothetical protein